MICQRPEPAYCEAGEIVWAAIRDTRFHPDNDGKIRPVVVIKVVNGFAQVLKLTTVSTYTETGRDRLQLDVGFREPTYLWSHQLLWVPCAYLKTHAGWLPEDALLKLLANVQIPTAARAGFQLGVYRRREQSL